MVASFESQPHGGRALERHTRPDPRRYGTPASSLPNILYQGTMRSRQPARVRSTDRRLRRCEPVPRIAVVRVLACSYACDAAFAAGVVGLWGKEDAMRRLVVMFSAATLSLLGGVIATSAVASGGTATTEPSSAASEAPAATEAPASAEAGPEFRAVALLDAAGYEAALGAPLRGGPQDNGGVNMQYVGGFTSSAFLVTADDIEVT